MLTKFFALHGALSTPQSTCLTPCVVIDTLFTTPGPTIRYQDPPGGSLAGNTQSINNHTNFRPRAICKLTMHIQNLLDYFLILKILNCNKTIIISKKDGKIVFGIQATLGVDFFILHQYTCVQYILDQQYVILGYHVTQLTLEIHVTCMYCNIHGLTQCSLYSVASVSPCNSVLPALSDCKRTNITLYKHTHMVKTILGPTRWLATWQVKSKLELNYLP